MDLFRPVIVSADRSIVRPVVGSWITATPLAIALAKSCCTAAALETPDSWTTAKITHRPKTRLPGVIPVAVGATATVLVAVVTVVEAVKLVVTVVEVAVV